MAYKFHFSAGYELSSVRDKIRKTCQKPEDFAKYEGLSRALSSFLVKTDCDLDDIPKGKDNGFAFILHNIFMRGIPTFASFGLEDDIKKNTGLINFRESSTKSFEHRLIDNIDIRLLWKALYFIEPRINRQVAFENNLISWENHGSEFEERYLYKELPNSTFDGKGDFLIQLLQPQRSMTSIVPEKLNDELNAKNFREQNVDFALEYPYPVTNNQRNGFCLEIDGSQHEDPQQKFLDKRRDDVVLESGWSNTVRIKTKEFNPDDLLKHFQTLNEREFSKSIYSAYLNNYNTPLYDSKDGLLALELVLSPMAVARIHLVLIKAVISGVLSFDEDVWRIAVLERDVPCARLAIDDFLRFLTAFSELEDKGRQFPKIKLEVYYTTEFYNSSARHAEDLPIEEVGLKNIKFDLYIDISILERDGLSKRNESVIYDAYVQIRSAFHFPKKQQAFLTTKRVLWGNLVEPDGTDKWKDHPRTSKALEFFIQNIFRKKSFREGQLRILDRALKNQTVIGLLPTGGGKSLTYQLAGLLQPGHVIVIDPIKSLMKDQVDSLARIGITGTVYINSALKDFEARNNARKILIGGHALFAFVSPERMMIQQFRNDLSEMENDRHYFSYGVIDEVHCVSEWGHNFRTPYLSLGKNLMQFCKAADGEIALFGLTATASFDVLSDVQRELSGNIENQMIPDEAIIRHENTNRDELQYYVEKVDLNEETILDLQNNSKGAYFELSLNKEFGLEKQRRINQLLSEPGKIIRKFNTNVDEVVNDDLIQLTYPEGQYPSSKEVHDRIKIPKESYEGDFWNYSDQEGNNNASLIFAPHKTWFFGVTDKYRSDDRRVGITESILKSNILPEEKVGTFMGVDSDDEATSNRLQEDNDINQESFIEGKQQLMIATKAFGMGIDKPNIRLTIHNNFPDSIESFVQEAGRGGRDRKLSVACILFNEQEIADPLKDKVYNHDFDLQESFFWNSFKGEEHEKETLAELLTEIEFPGKDRIEQLTRLLNNKPEVLDLGISIRIGHFDVRNRLYVNLNNFINTEKKDFGYLDYETGEVVTRWATEDYETSFKVVSTLKSIIDDLAIGIAREDIQSWLKESQGPERKPGIQKILGSISYGDKFEIIVPFVNDHSQVYEKLAKHILVLSKQIESPTNIKKYSAFCKSSYNANFNKFLENIDQKTGIIQWFNVKYTEEPSAAESFKYSVQKELDKKRDKQDTEKAIFRFSVMGLIDDYTVDYNSETYVLRGEKRYTEEYHDALRFYISKYYSEKRTENIIKTLNSREGDSEIQRLLNFVTSFVYKEVAKKRQESISFMRECCKVGLSRGNIEMKTYIHLYFNSKYARKGYSVKIEDVNLVHFSNLPLMSLGDDQYNASLFDWTNEGLEEEFDYVIDFMHLMVFDNSNSERDNLKHLRGACARMIMTNPDNYVFRFLRAFSVMVLEENKLKKNLKAAILEDFKIAYTNLFEREGEEFDMDEALMHYKAAMIDKLQNESTKEWFLEVMEDLEFLAHVGWTNKFTERFTKDLIL